MRLYNQVGIYIYRNTRTNTEHTNKLFNYNIVYSIVITRRRKKKKNEFVIKIRNNSDILKRLFFYLKHIDRFKLFVTGSL